MSNGLTYYVVDTETTGLSPAWHEVSQVSIIRCSDRNQINRYIKVEHPERAQKQALDATGRTWADLKKGDPKQEVVEYCNKFITQDGLTDEHRCFIAHNANFDQRFSDALWKSCGLEFPGRCWLDTKPLAKAWANKLGLIKPSLTLTSCLDFTGIKKFAGVHEASSDAKNTYLLWKKAMDEGLDHLSCIKRYAPT